MRVLILHRVGGMVRGVHLSEFLPGLFYDVDEAVSSHLIAVRAAVEVPTAVVPPYSDAPCSEPTTSKVRDRRRVPRAGSPRG